MIKDNEIRLLADGAVGVGLMSQVSQARITDNELEGVGAIGFGFFGCGCGEKDDLFGNTLVDNEVDELTTSVADVFFAEPAHDNVVRDGCRTFLDFGTNNDIECEGDDDSASAVASTQLVTAGWMTPAPARPRPQAWARP